ncbi:hypothetical protein [Streptomyces bobili]|uniref:Uncharacterized protein n=1 Tax=Streptomyces bobili TaxID=67280 RepID=A0ABZ1R565_9ACTN|nr:hypothetical protein [Streptomyces bobili]
MAPPPHTHVLLDIGIHRDLIRYAVASHIARLEERGEFQVSNKELAVRVGMKESQFSHALGDAPDRFGDAHLARLDLIMTALGVEHAGGLGALAVRLRGSQDQAGPVEPHTPASRHDQLLARVSDDEDIALAQVEALVSQLRVLSDLRRPLHRQLRDRRDAVRKLVARLILIGAAPPTRRNVEALIWLGTLSGYAFDLMAGQLEKAVRTAPLGFRVWRAVTKSVLLNTAKTAHADKAALNALRACVGRLLGDAEKLRMTSLYPGRSLDLELAIAVPADWSAPAGPQDENGDWVGRMLLTRAQNRDATLRERGTAAHGLWQRAVAGRGWDRAVVGRHLEALIGDFEDARDRPDIAAGLRWTAATLRVVMERDEGVCNDWPHTDEPWFHAVMDAAARLGADPSIPDHVRPGTRKLFEHALLQNAGVSRRQAIDTIVAAGWAEQVATALIEILAREEVESWLRIRALFALGFLQCRSEQVEDALVEACLVAHDKLTGQKHPGDHPATVTELHAALFSVGDCFGARGAEAQARAVRKRLKDVLEQLAGNGSTNTPQAWPVARATAYLLTVTAQDREDDRPDLAEELLTVLTRHRDEVTRKLSAWALDFRFDDDEKHTVRPLIAAAGGS